MLDFGRYNDWGVNWADVPGLSFWGDGTGTPTPDPVTAPPTNPQTGFQNLITKQGGADAAAFLLYQENHSYREKLRLAEQQLSDLRGKLPGEGTIVLDADKAKAWEAYQGLGTPDEVKKARDEYATMKRDTHFRTIAEVYGYNPVVLSGLPGAADLTIEMGEETLNGKTAKVAYVVQQDGKKIALPDYAQKTWGAFLPALTVNTGQQATTNKGGTPFIRQQTGGNGAGNPDKVQEYKDQQRKAREGKTNPLMTGI